jgi:hypothetical protein
MYNNWESVQHHLYSGQIYGNRFPNKHIRSTTRRHEREALSLEGLDNLLQGDRTF